jgi:hypothetical protein
MRQLIPRGRLKGGPNDKKVCASPATFPQRPSCVNALSFLFDRFGPFYFWLRFGFGVNELLFHGARFVNAMKVKPACVIDPQMYVSWRDCAALHVTQKPDLSIMV